NIFCLDPNFDLSTFPYTDHLAIIEVVDPDNGEIVGSASINGSIPPPLGITTNIETTGILPISELELEALGFIQEGKDYEFRLHVENGRGSFDLFYDIPTNANATIEKVVGGLRIKEISSGVNNIGTANNIVKSYEYQKSDSNPKSSGILFNLPQYSWSGIYVNGYGGNYYHAAATSIVPLGNFDGKHIGYERVVENHHSGGNATGNGRTIYSFLTEQSVINNDFPRVPTLLRAHDGKSEAVNVYTSQGSSPVKTSVITPRALNYNTVPGTIYTTTTIPGCPSPTILVNGYFPRVGVYQVETIEETLDGVTTITDYGYDPQDRHLQPTSTTFTNSDGKQTTNFIKYAHEMLDATGATVYQTMINSHNMIGIPIERIQRVDNNDVKGSRTVYDTFGGFPYPSQFYTLDGSWDINGNLVYDEPSGDHFVWKGTINSYQNGQPTQFTKRG
ncbi:MAG: hypothetical protein AAF573_17880, partial [Bacteroidota bacterium]